MARTIEQLQAAVAKEERTMAEATGQMTRDYARERINYLRGEIALQRAKVQSKEANRLAIATGEHPLAGDYRNR